MNRRLDQQRTDAHSSCSLFVTHSELVHHEPAGGRKLPISPSAAAPAAASSSLGSPKSVQVQHAQAASPTHSSGIGGAAKRTGPRVAITGVRLAYNDLHDLKGFVEAMELLLGPEACTQLTWLDLSHNKLCEIDDVLLAFPNLTTLYLHGNGINAINEVKKLSGLTKLSKLTIHGNPIYEPKQNHNLRNPRSGIIYHLRDTQLRSLDFVTITNADRSNALRWAQQNKPKKKRRTGEEGDEDEGSPVRR